MNGIFKSLINSFKVRFNDRSKKDDIAEIAAREQKKFSYKKLARATDNFHSNCKLGQGGFGPVYKGKLDDGREIAVKMLSRTSRQGKKEFTTEAKLLARLQHRNIVNLLGYCAHGQDKLIVYEYIHHPDKKDKLDWKRRYDIIAGIAKGLLYLHEGSHSCIVHRDIKASNVLLDENWVPKIADFGMARLFPEDQTHVNTRIAGTNGYMAPEYVMHNYLSVKADVFSFGVLMLELVSGQKNSSFNASFDEQSLLDWAYNRYRKGRSLAVMDPALTSTAVAEQVSLCVHVGLLCTQSDPELRPTMNRVDILLSKKSSTLEEPARPGFPGTRYRRSPRPRASSSDAGTSGASSSRVESSTNSVIATATTSTARSTKSDRHGKRPMNMKSRWSA
ncbi:hypothetical protein Nepgr_003816 [Nepenthes gracilis]|uniref:Protein kinase domain-containing protein n=1 Tax=Nepenthes gracilis TaxID=150966 RepID=A0AAD3XEA2_NEPGR|nr:hypothetical protein Nepgr_003816 [Nepenthes gracilis]